MDEMRAWQVNAGLAPRSEPFPLRLVKDFGLAIADKPGPVLEDVVQELVGDSGRDLDPFQPGRYQSCRTVEQSMADVLVKMARSRPVVAVGSEVPQESLREPPEFAGQYDPHIWFDVRLWTTALEPIARELAELDPAHADDYRANAERVRRELQELDRWTEERIAEIPEARRVLVTAHDAFGYFGRRYGLEVHGIQGISTLSEAGLQDVEQVVDLVVSRRIPAIFVESSVPRRTVEAVVQAAAEQGHQVRVGGELFSDALGPEGTPEGTYDGMVRHNVDTIVEALRAEP